MSQELPALQAWYRRQCDGEWEHGYGVRIETLDNPGWSLTVDLRATALADRAFAPIQERMDDPLAWVSCSLADGAFRGFGGPEQLARLIQIFLTWADAAPA